MENEIKLSAIHRLRSVAGHVNSVDRRVAADKYCVDVIKQIQAVQAALTKVSELVLSGHLHACVTTAIRGDDASERERVLNEIMDVYKLAGK